MYNIRYYAIGHSYLRHGPFEGWQTDGFWGMAASEPSKDYFHRFTDMLTEALPAKVEALAENHAEYERCCILGATKEDYVNSVGYKHMTEVIREFKPNVISVFVGGGNTIANDEESLTYFFDVLFEMINSNKREDTVVLCVGMNYAYPGLLKGCEKYGFISVDARFIHEINGPDNPYYAFRDYPEYDEAAKEGAVEFRTHPGDLGHEAIAKAMLDAAIDAIKSGICEGEYGEEYKYDEYIVPTMIEKFNISMTPELPIRFEGFNLRLEDGCVVFSSAPGTGASIATAVMNMKPIYKKLSVEMSVKDISDSRDLILTVSANDGVHRYALAMTDSEMRKYEFDISDITSTIRSIRISPDMSECLVTVKSIELK